MRLKNKTIFAITVKLLFAASLVHAQSPRDSATQKLIQFYPASNSTPHLVKYPAVGAYSRFQHKVNNKFARF